MMSPLFLSITQVKKYNKACQSTQAALHRRCRIPNLTFPTGGGARCSAPKGQSIGLVCDAGTPGISDPGFYLIRRCAEEGIPTIPIPGPTAAMAALVASGLPTDSFLFVGFLPKKHIARLKRLALLKDTPATLIFYESPYRVAKALQDYLEVLGNRQAVIARELTKGFEELMRGRLEQLFARLQGKKGPGEIKPGI